MLKLWKGLGDFFFLNRGLVAVNLFFRLSDGLGVDVNFQTTAFKEADWTKTEQLVWHDFAKTSPVGNFAGKAWLIKLPQDDESPIVIKFLTILLKFIQSFLNFCSKTNNIKNRINCFFMCQIPFRLLFEKIWLIFSHSALLFTLLQVLNSEFSMIETTQRS